MRLNKPQDSHLLLLLLEFSHHFHFFSMPMHIRIIDTMCCFILHFIFHFLFLHVLYLDKEELVETEKKLPQQQNINIPISVVIIQLSVYCVLCTLCVTAVWQGYVYDMIW